MASEADLASALAFALTGERLALSAVDSLDDELAAAGFPPHVLGEIRAGRQHDELVWPFPVPIDERRSLGFARFDAALAEARRVLGLTGLTAATPAARPPDRDEQRLLQDRPPHW